MDPQDAIDLSQEAIRTCIFVGGPILAVSLLIGLVVSMVQSMTQLHDQSIAFVPKILLMLVAIAVALPWLADRMIGFTKYSLEKPVFFQTTSNDDSANDRGGETDSRFTYAWLDSPKTESNQSALPTPTLPTSVKPTPAKLTAPSMPMLRSKQAATQPQLKLPPQPKLQSRVASPFSLPTFRSADSESQPSDAPVVETKTF